MAREMTQKDYDERQNWTVVIKGDKEAPKTTKKQKPKK
jgi:hypothetical protein